MDFSTWQKDRMKAIQTAHMQDTCVIQTCTQTYDADGQAIKSFADGSAIECGLNMSAGSERFGSDNTIVQYDAVLRLAITRTPTEIDRIKITKRFEETLGTPLVYEIVSPIQRGVSGIRILLRRIET
jgi:head-tail adaptor